MPRYDFQCIKCKNVFEVTLMIGAALPSCPTCGSRRTEKLLSPPTVIFKGTGFYKTDSIAKPKSKSETKPAVTADATGNKSNADSPKESGGESVKKSRINPNL